MNCTSFLEPSTESILLLACTCISLLSLTILCTAPCFYIELNEVVSSTNKKVRQIKEIVRTSAQKF